MANDYGIKGPLRTPPEVKAAGGNYDNGVCELRAPADGRGVAAVPPKEGGADRVRTLTLEAVPTSDNMCVAGESGCVPDVPKYEPKGLTRIFSAMGKVLAALTPLSLGGCTPATPESEGTKTCTLLNVSDEKKYCSIGFFTEGKNRLEIDEGFFQKSMIGKSTVEYLRNQLDVCAKEVESIFSFPFEWPGITQRLISTEWYSKFCPDDSVACASPGRTEHWVSDGELISLNNEIETGARRNDGFCHNLFSTVHELSHAKRIGQMFPWWVAEEGLARLTERLYADRRPDRSTTLAQDVFHTGEEVWNGTLEANTSFQPHLPSVNRLWLHSIGEEGVMVGYSKSSSTFDLPDGGLPKREYTAEPIPAGQCEDLFGILVCVDAIDGNTATISVYDRKGFVGVRATCGEEEFSDTKVFFTADGVRSVQGSSHLYADYDAATSSHGAMYPVGYCFWDRIAQRSGMDSVMKVVETMMDAGKQYVGSFSTFPLFKTIQKITGIDASNLTEIFDTHDIPTEDEFHYVGD